MPRVNLGKDPIELQRERLAHTTAKIIRKAMIDRNMRYGKDVADLVKMNRNTFAYKMRAGSWSQMDHHSLPGNRRGVSGQGGGVKAWNRNRR